MTVEVDRWKWINLVCSEQGPPDPTTRLVLMTISLHMNQRGDHAWPSQKLIAQRSGLSDRSVRTHLDKASEGGWVQVSVKGMSGQGWRINEYVACIPDSLEGDALEHPWEADPTWKREEHSSAPTRTLVTQRAEQIAAPIQTLGIERAEQFSSASIVGDVLASMQFDEGAENGAEGAENDDTRCGTSFRKVRNHVPTTHTSTLSMNHTEEGALSGETTPQVAEVIQVNALTPLRSQRQRGKRQLSDTDLLSKVEKLTQAGCDSVDSLLKALTGNFEGITVDRLRGLAT